MNGSNSDDSGSRGPGSTNSQLAQCMQVYIHPYCSTALNTAISQVFSELNLTMLAIKGMIYIILVNGFYIKILLIYQWGLLTKYMEGYAS